MSKRHFGLGMPVYPSATSRRGERVKRTPYRRCRNCGSPNDTRRVGVGKGDGLRLRSDLDPNEWDVKAGCNFCGSKLWHRGGSTPLKDDKRLDINRRMRV